MAPEPEMTRPDFNATLHSEVARLTNGWPAWANAQPVIDLVTRRWHDGYYDEPSREVLLKEARRKR